MVYLLVNYAADHSEPNTLKMMLSAKDRKGNTPIMDALDVGILQLWQC